MVADTVVIDGLLERVESNAMPNRQSRVGCCQYGNDVSLPLLEPKIPKPSERPYTEAMRRIIIIIMDPDICNRQPTIEGTRIAVQTVLEFLAGCA